MNDISKDETSQLAAKHCVPCEIGTKPFDLETVQGLLPMVPKWKPDENAKKIVRSFRFKDFIEAMRFINKIAEIAETEGHHPDLFVSYNYVKIALTTHNISGLSENDFIMAAKIDEVFEETASSEKQLQ
ncbi:MAG TPA: 4a-hydroxytetrahydrobiopterin dehydratase [Candidatus Acidoferrales bacterium]|nr:4a-hydroxytetrahydrobiopterin dehydratase [Candidatus Acidoferrales bacterium]